MDTGFSFGIWRSEQTRLRGIGGTAGAVGFGTFAGDAVAVGPVLDNQIERQWREKELVLGNGQTAFAAFHGGAPVRLIRRVKGGIFVAGVNPSAGAKLPARVLPKLPPPVPMESKLRQLRRHVARLLLLKLNPNPLADNLAQFPKAGCFMVKQVNDLRCGKSPVLKSESEINPMQLF
jgi:hypothetical protein